MTKTAIALISALYLAEPGCDDHKPTSDDVQKEQQEKLLAEGTAQTGMPAIKNFRERRLLKDILELRDQADLTTYTYVQSEMTGKLVFFCDSIGYAIPYATQYTNPQKVEDFGGSNRYAFLAVPQADPNGLFSPASAEGSWIMCKNPNGAEVKPVYVEPRVVVSPFKLSAPAVAETPVAAPAAPSSSAPRLDGK
jgi:hypothetical protein